MTIIEFGLVLLIAVAIGGVIVKWARMPLPILLVIVGAIASFVPGLPRLEINADVFLLLFLPPILFADAYLIPRRDFVQTLSPVLLLALGLVVLTVVTIGYLFHWLVPAMPLAVAMTLGAIVSPTDAVATVATTATVPLPARVVNIVNAESLLNDASGLVAFKLAVAAAATGLFSSGDAALEFVTLAGGGIAIGILLQWGSRRVMGALSRMRATDATVLILVSLLTPYAAYLAAESLHVSGILAVVAAGLWASGMEIPDLQPEARRHLREVWHMLGFVLNGVVFVLLGLQLRSMVASVAEYSTSQLILYSVVLWIALMLLRLGWVYASAYVRFHTHLGWTGSKAGPDPRRVFLMGWAAVRGSITLAAALSLPILMADGSPFPQRDLVVFLAAATIILTLALNGVPLGWIIRRLQVPLDPEQMQEERIARIQLARVGAHAIEGVISQLDHPEDVVLATQFLTDYAGRVELLSDKHEAVEARNARVTVRRQLRLTAIRAEREKLRELHADDVINDETARVIGDELDEREMVASLNASRA